MIPTKELRKVLEAYNKYIQEANEEDKYKSGWLPVCVDEFYNNEFQELKKGCGDIYYVSFGRFVCGVDGLCPSCKYKEVLK